MNIRVWKKTATCIGVIGLLASGCTRQVIVPRPSSSAINGGADGGGGNLPQSTATEVRATVTEVMNSTLPVALYNMAMGIDQIEDGYVLRVMQRFFPTAPGAEGWETTAPVLVDIDHTPYELLDTGACEDNGGLGHAGGVAKRELGAKICYSIEKLRLVPKEELSREILALAAHEFVHHFGFGELEASKMQFYVRKNAETLGQSFPTRFKIDFKTFSIPPSAQRMQYLVFQQGRIQLRDDIGDDLAASDSRFCAFELQYSSDELAEGESTFPDLTYEKSGIEFNMTEASSRSSSLEKRSHIVSFGALVNPVIARGTYTSAGAALSGANDQASLIYFTCHGKDLRFGDLISIFGDYAIPRILNP